MLPNIRKPECLIKNYKMNEKEKAIELFKKYYCLENNSKKRIRVIEFAAADFYEQVLKEIDLI